MNVDVTAHTVIKLVYGDFRLTGITQDELVRELCTHHWEPCGLTRDAIADVDYTTVGVILDVLVGARLLLWENPDDPRYFPALLAPL